MAVEPLWHGLRYEVWQQLISILSLMVILIPAAIGDYQRQRIPNWLSMSGWLVGPLVASIFTGGEGAGNSLLGLAVIVGLLFPFWVIHWFGAADVKLMGSVGALVGLSDSLLVLAGVLLTGMVMAVIVIIYHKIRLLLPNGGDLSKNKGNSRSGIRGAEGKESMLIPYGVSIAFGTMITILLLQLSK